MLLADTGEMFYAKPEINDTCSYHSSEEEKDGVAESPARPAHIRPPHRVPFGDRVS